MLAAVRLVVDLRDLGKGDLPLAGGKGANLGELIRAGFPVPPGFVVTTAAYDRAAAAGANRESLLRAPIPDDLAEAVRAAYRALGAPAVAVRSSATAEDLPEAAFAGQQDTFLNVVGEPELLEAMRRCWASLFTDRAVAYRERQKVDPATVKLAVVVQRLVPAEWAGVMFTANPVTGARAEVVVDGSPGLGESVVSGLVTPDHFLLRRRAWGFQVLERARGRRELAVRPKAGGGVEHVVGLAKGGGMLDGRVVKRLAAMGARIAAHFGAPQDIEWTYDAGGTISIVQSRPVTALPPEPPKGRAGRGSVIQRMAAEMIPGRPYPLDLDVWLPALFRAPEPMFRTIGLRASILRALDVEDGVVLRLSGRVPFRPGPGVFLAPARILWRAFRFDPRRFRSDRDLLRGLQLTRELEKRDLGPLDWAGLHRHLRQVEDLPETVAGNLRGNYMWRGVLGVVRLRLLLAMARRRDRVGALLSGTDSLTSEANAALEVLAAKVRAEPELGRVFEERDGVELLAALRETAKGRELLGALQGFLDVHGHREVLISTAREPTWKDAPELVLGILKGLSEAPPPPRPAQKEWEQARDELLAGSALGRPPLRGAFLSALSAARCVLQIREDTHYYGTMTLALLHRALREMGLRLVAAGALDAPEDIFHLRRSELEAWPPPAGLREIAARRKRAREALGEGPLVDVRQFRPAGLERGAVARGTAGSPGLARGPVRVVRTPAEFGKLKAGDVLVAPFTNPAWTPLFQRAAAVVVDSGSAASHAAIVAREYGIPAVMGTGDGTERLTDGQRVKVDGDRGLVLADLGGAQAPSL